MPSPKEIAREVLSRQSELEHDRAPNEPVWEQVADFCDPDGPTINWHSRHSDAGSGSGSQASRSDDRARLVYDVTIASAGDRLTAGLESLITPQSDKWHGITTAAMNDEETEEEKEWAESLRDFLFEMRYSAASNFVPSIQSCYHNVVRYGPAYLYAEEGFAGQHIRYASVPVAEGYIARNRWGEADIFHRCYQRTARQCAQLFGHEKLPPKIKALVDDPAKALEKVSLIQCVQPRQERRTYDLAGERVFLDSPFASYHVIEQEETVVKERSFQSFPIADFNWRRHENDNYGISPTIKALTVVREINAIRRTSLRTLQAAVDPATASKASVDDVPVLNPGVNYPGLVDDQGNLLVKPINTGARPDYGFDYAGNRAEEIRDMLYVNLFQTLVQNPQMTATEALIRQEEKGALLGPAGSSIQRGFALNLDRELSILEEKGLYAPDSRFLPPQSLAGKSLRPTFTSPLDIFRKAAEARDTDMVVMALAQYAEAKKDPSVLDVIDDDEYARIKLGSSRAPQRLYRRKEELDGLRKARADAQKAQAGLAGVQQLAATAKDGVPAMVQARDAGLLPSMIPQ